MDSTLPGVTTLDPIKSMPTLTVNETLIAPMKAAPTFVKGAHNLLANNTFAFSRNGETERYSLKDKMIGFGGQLGALNKFQSFLNTLTAGSYVFGEEFTRGVGLIVSESLGLVTGSANALAKVGGYSTPDEILKTPQTLYKAMDDAMGNTKTAHVLAGLVGGAVVGTTAVIFKTVAALITLALNSSQAALDFVLLAASKLTSLIIGGTVHLVALSVLHTANFVKNNPKMVAAGTLVAGVLSSPAIAIASTIGFAASNAAIAGFGIGAAGVIAAGTVGVIGFFATPPGWILAGAVGGALLIWVVVAAIRHYKKTHPSELQQVLMELRDVKEQLTTTKHYLHNGTPTEVDTLLRDSYTTLTVRSKALESEKLDGHVLKKEYAHTVNVIGAMGFAKTTTNPSEVADFLGIATNDALANLCLDYVPQGVTAKDDIRTVQAMHLARMLITRENPSSVTDLSDADIARYELTGTDVHLLSQQARWVVNDDSNIMSIGARAIGRARSLLEAASIARATAADERATEAKRKAAEKAIKAFLGSEHLRNFAAVLGRDYVCTALESYLTKNHLLTNNYIEHQVELDQLATDFATWNAKSFVGKRRNTVTTVRPVDLERSTELSQLPIIVETADEDNASRSPTPTSGGSSGGSSDI